MRYIVRSLIILMLSKAVQTRNCGQHRLPVCCYVDNEVIK